LEIEQLKIDIQVLKNIFERLDEHHDEDSWVLTEPEFEQLSKITGLDYEHNWNCDNLRYFIAGMERTSHLLDVFKETSPNNVETKSEEKKLSYCRRCAL